MGQGQGTEKPRETECQDCKKKSIHLECRLCRYTYCTSCDPKITETSCMGCELFCDNCPNKKCQTNEMKTIHQTLKKSFDVQSITRIVSNFRQEDRMTVYSHETCLRCEHCRALKYQKLKSCGHYVSSKEATLTCASCETTKCFVCLYPYRVDCKTCGTSIVICQTCRYQSKKPFTDWIIYFLKEPLVKSDLPAVDLKESLTDLKSDSSVVDGVTLYRSIVQCKKCLPRPCTSCSKMIKEDDKCKQCNQPYCSKCRSYNGYCRPCMLEKKEELCETCDEWISNPFIMSHGGKSCFVCHSEKHLKPVPCATKSCASHLGEKWICCRHQTADGQQLLRQCLECKTLLPCIHPDHVYECFYDCGYRTCDHCIFRFDYRILAGEKQFACPNCTGDIYESITMIPKSVFQMIMQYIWIQPKQEKVTIDKSFTNVTVKSSTVADISTDIAKYIEDGDYIGLNAMMWPK
jgi:hypothetical protein